jgi:hypothetical protein
MRRIEKGMNSLRVKQITLSDIKGAAIHLNGTIYYSAVSLPEKTRVVKPDVQSA